MPNKKYDKRKRKIQLNQINRIIKEVNHTIAADNLWRGRFEAQLIKYSSYKFPDGSGIDGFIAVAYIDRATKRVLGVGHYEHIKGCDNEKSFWRKSLMNKLYYGMNFIITERSGVWKNEATPWELAEKEEYDFTKKGSYHMSKEEAYKIAWDRNNVGLWF